MNTEIKKLKEFLQKAPDAKTLKVWISEDSDADNLYALQLHTKNPELTQRLALYFGAPTDNEIDVQFEASDSWHGKGPGNFRALADEITAATGLDLFVDLELSVQSLNEMMIKQKGGEALRDLLRSRPSLLTVGNCIATFEPYTGPNPDDELGYLALPDEVGGGFTVDQAVLDSTTLDDNGNIHIKDPDGLDWVVQGFRTTKYNDPLLYIGFTENQTKVILKAVNLYCRLGLGQFEEAGDVICELHPKKAEELGVTHWDLKENTFDNLKKQFGFSTNGSHGIVNKEVSEQAKIAHDLGDEIKAAQTTAGFGLKTSQEPKAKIL